jgi:glutathione S-transferase
MASGRPGLLTFAAPRIGADLNLASILVWGKMGRLDLSAHLDVARWLDSCLARPAYRRVRDRIPRK